MNILYIGYWSVNEGLSVATIKPHLEALSEMNSVSSITYVSIEREGDIVRCCWAIPRMQHIPYYSPPKPFLLDKLYDFIQLPSQLAKLCKKKHINKVICRGSPAGGLGYLVWRKTKLPYYVESFEPHAEYMLEGKVWTSYDPRYRLQRYLENRQKHTASGLMPVSENYTRHLKIIEKLDCPIETIPCGVDLEKFKFNKEYRQVVRNQYNIDEKAVVGIYVGKFGDIYYEDEAFLFFKDCYDNISNFFLLLLCPQEESYIVQKLTDIRFPLEKCWNGTVKHEDVTKYLSASDFSICPVKSSSNRKFCSPIKNGEYWANGLPVLISEGIGDDSDIIKEQGGGMVIDFEKKISDSIFTNIKEMIIKSNLGRTDNLSVKNARRYRAKHISKVIYYKLLLNEDI